MNIFWDILSAGVVIFIILLILFTAVIWLYLLFTKKRNPKPPRSKT